MLAHVSGMDESVGKIVESYRRHGFWDNTILIFSSDNGGSKVPIFVYSRRGQILLTLADCLYEDHLLLNC